MVLDRSVSDPDSHFQDVARGHFIVRRMEQRYNWLMAKEVDLSRWALLRINHCGHVVALTKTDTVWDHSEGNMNAGIFLNKMLGAILVINLLLPSVSRGDSTSPTGVHEIPPLLQKVQQEVENVLEEIDHNLGASAKELARTGLDSPEARSILAGMCPSASYPFLVDCCTVDSKGRMLLVEPARYRSSEGADISGQEQIIRLHATKRPVMSRTIAMVEGFDAIDLEQPILSRSGEFMGSVSMLIRPEALLASVIQPAIKGYPVNIWVVETNGRILYDGHEREIGRNLFHDPSYKPFKDLQSLGARIAAEPAGQGNYEYYEKGPDSPVVTKRAAWTTVGLHGTEWRLVLAHVADSVAESEGSSNFSVLDRIGKLCVDAELQKALARQDKPVGLSKFKKFYEENPGLYSIQWIDPKGKNRFGYPPENSIENASIRKHELLTDRPFLEAIAGKVATVVELPLGEGGVGVFHLHPIYWGEQYLGMVYAISRKQ
jgi:hypothetical protein